MCAQHPIATVTLANVSKTYRKSYDLFGKRTTHTVLDHANLIITRNEKIGLIGKNGCGKTTLLKLIAGLIDPTDGKITIEGQSSLMLANDLLYHRLTGRQNLQYICEAHRIGDMERKIQRIAKILELDHLDNYVETYSFGTKTKLALARALLEDKQLLLLDEPTAGLDDQTTKTIWKLIKGLKKTVIITGHRKEELVGICNTIYDLTEGIPRKLP